MSTFANAVLTQDARTANGMKALKSTGSAVLDLYANIGASRGKDIIPAFTAAFVENKELAIRVALWARDVRGGAGERKVFRDILAHLCDHDPELATRILVKVPELGRWDDLLATKGETRQEAFELIRVGLENPKAAGLVAKWMPRKGEVAAELREFLGMTPKQYRKTLVNLTKVVESLMCANKWDEIDFSTVPSLASSRYKKAFNRHTVNSGKFKDYVEKLVKGDKSVKVNTGAVYPYDILKGVNNLHFSMPYGKTELDHIVAQWNALPNFVGDANILPLVDVSGSMTWNHLTKSGLTPLDVAVSLGLYLADKNTGKFKDMFLTFSHAPELLLLKGNVIEKAKQMVTSKWGGNTNLHAAFERMLDVAVKAGVPQSEMPKTVLILSDMQFDSCVTYDDTAIQMIARKYQAAGYDVPNVVFWNLNAAYGNQPVEFNRQGVALVSGFSPSLVKGLGSIQNFTPEKAMMDTIMNPRYDF